MDNFAVFILTHGRANNVITYNTLKKCGYTGKIYLLVDSFDKQIDEYKSKYGHDVIIFDKQKAIDMTDSGDNQKKHNSVVYARNYNFVVAKELGIDYFLQLDDDYKTIAFSINEDLSYIGHDAIINIDYIFSAFVDYLKSSKIKSIAFAQGGDFIGGENGHVFSQFEKGEISRKVMNAFFFATDNPVSFIGRINEDVNLYVSQGNRGDMFVTHPGIRLEQLETQQNSGGLTEIYLDIGTYCKSFYSVLYAPSCVKVAAMVSGHQRLHHRVNWNNAVPKIIHQSYKK
jgi:hypothetical protein